MAMGAIKGSHLCHCRPAYQSRLPAAQVTGHTSVVRRCELRMALERTRVRTWTQHARYELGDAADGASEEAQCGSQITGCHAADITHSNDS